VLGEQVCYAADGQLLNASFMDYSIPRATDIPFMRTAHHAVPCLNNPLGVKGAGESGVAISFITADMRDHFALIEKRHDHYIVRERLEGFEPTEESTPRPVNTAGGGVKGHRKSKKDKLREAAARKP